MSIYTLFAEIRDRGLLVNNLFQLDDGTWQANLRTLDDCTEFGLGATPDEALSACLAKYPAASVPPGAEDMLA